MGEGEGRAEEEAAAGAHGAQQAEPRRAQAADQEGPR